MIGIHYQADGISGIDYQADGTSSTFINHKLQRTVMQHHHQAIHHLWTNAYV